MRRYLERCYTKQRGGHLKYSASLPFISKERVNRLICQFENHVILIKNKLRSLETRKMTVVLPETCPKYFKIEQYFLPTTYSRYISKKAAETEFYMGLKE
jgi:hypothetical protein